MPAEDVIARLADELVKLSVRVSNLERLETSSYTAHDPVTLDMNSVQVNKLTGQELGHQVQAHNCVWSGPESGAAAVPTFRLLIAGDMPANVLTVLDAPLTSTNFDGDSYSTTAKTAIDLSSIFGAPAGIKAVLMKAQIKDSGSAAGFCTLILGPSSTANVGLEVSCSGLTNDAAANGCLLVPCNATGDICYQIYASDANTMDVTLQVWGYCEGP